MKNHHLIRITAFLLALVCVVGFLPAPASAVGALSSAPASITQQTCDFMKVGGQVVHYKSASSLINDVGQPSVFDEQMDVPGYGPARALCAKFLGRLSYRANGQRWNFKEEVSNASLKTILTYVYSHTNGDFTDAGRARGLDQWGEGWTNLWFITAQGLSWYYEYGILKDVNVNREAFIEQVAEEFLAAMKLCHDAYNWAHWITDWDSTGIHTIIDSADNGVTGNSSYDFAAVAVNTVLDHPEYYHKYHLWLYAWDTSQDWLISGDGVMQDLLVAIPDPEDQEEPVSLTVKKLEAGTNQPLSGVTFTVENAVNASLFSVTKTTGPDGSFTLTAGADGLTAGQYRITETAAPEGYTALTASRLVTVLPGSAASGAVTFYNETQGTVSGGGEGSIRKVDADNPAVGIPGAVIRVTSVQLDEGGSFTGTYVTGDGGYISTEDLDFSALPTGSYVAEEITPPQGYILSSDVSKVKQAFVWDGTNDVSLVFENSAKVRVRLQKVDESGKPLAGAVFIVLRDGQVIATEETGADGAITVSNVSEGYYEFIEVSAPAGYDCDRSPVGVYVNAWDLQGEQTITVTKVNHHKRSLTVSKRDAETGAPVPNTTFHIRGVNIGYENDVTTGADGRVTLTGMASGCYEITETSVPSPYILDTNNRKTVWIDAEQDQDVTVDFVNSTKPGLMIRKIDAQTGEPLSGVQFRITEVNGSYNELHFTNQNGLIVLENLNPGAYTVTEVKPREGYVADDTVYTVYLEENKTTTLELSNLRKPDLFIQKVDSITGSPIQGVKFQIWRASDNTRTGEYNDLGIYYTDAQGQIHLERVETGWYKITELEPAPGFTIKQPDTQEIYLAAGKDYTVVFENTPKNAIIVEKYDSVTGEALPGCTFQLRYLSGTSGTGGTIIGQKVTGSNGICMWTGLEPGAYIVEEISPADGYSIINASETVFLADDGEQSVITVVFNNSPDGALLIRKVCAVNPSVTLQNAEFKITYSDGSFIGDSNGVYRTDENGEIRIEGLKPGKSVIVTEVKAPPGFIIDTQSQTIQIKEGRAVSLTFKNQPKGSLIVQKRDSQTGEVLPGAEFRITTAAGCEVGLDGVIGSSTLTQNGIFTTDSNGEIKITNLAPGAYIITEIKAPDGYVIDRASTNVVIGQGGDTQTVIIKNTKKGGLIVEKYDSVTRQPLAGARFKITTANGEFTPDNEGLTSSNGLYVTDANGQIILSKLLPGTYIVTEDLAPDNYLLDPTPQTVVVHAGDTQTIRFYDDPLCTLTLIKRDAVTKKPLPGAEFLVKDSSGRVIGPNNGLYVTGADGTVTVSGLIPNSTIVVSEVRAPSGYVLDQTPKNIVVRSGVANSLIFDDQPGTTLVIRKYIEGTDYEPLAGVAFKVTDGSGAAVGPDAGVYYTDHAGEIVLEGIEPGTTVIAHEIKTVEGYVLDGTPQTIKIVGGQVQQLTFWNKKAGTLVIQKKDSVTGALIPGAQFQLTYANGGYVDNDNGHLSSNGLYTTDQNGEIRISGITGTVVVKEVQAAPGYVIDPATQTQTVTVNPMDTQTLVFYNSPLSGILIHKTDSVTGRGIYGATFLLYDSTFTPIGQYTSDNQGYVFIENLSKSGRYYLRELENAGYVPDAQLKTVYVTAGETTLVEWQNTPITGQIQIIKTSADYNSMNGWPAGTPIPGTEFEIYDYRTGNLVDTVRTDRNGVAVSSPLPLGRYRIVESKAADFYVLDKTPIEAELEYAGQIVRVSMTNKSVSTNVSIQKTGYYEVMAGQNIRYTFSGIGNNSNTALTSFYWRDALPVEAVRLAKITTGTYNAAGSYKIVYRTNLSGGEYRVLADSLNTRQNYVLDASPVTLGLPSNEYVTEVLFVFGVVPANFAQVEAPKIDCTVASWVTGGSRFTNTADVGGVYNGQWIMAVARWTTSVYGKPAPLPVTGY